MPKAHVVNIHEAKTRLSQLIVEATQGTTVVIAKAGTPIVTLVPVGEEVPQRRPGYLKGKLRIEKDFDAPLPKAVQKTFEGRE
jgi:prevent-host-death family protein